VCALATMTVWLRAAATTLTFTPPSDLAAGTVITSTHAGFGGAALDLDNAGDTILAYQDADATPTFLFGPDFLLDIPSGGCYRVGVHTNSWKSSRRVASPEVRAFALVSLPRPSSECAATGIS